MKKVLIISLTIISFVVLAFVAYNYKTKTSFKYQNQEPKEVEQIAQDAISEVVNKEAQSSEPRRIDAKILQITNSELAIGDKNAPVVMIEYASLSCPHCAAFHREAFLKLKEEYIDSGKVRFSYRNFPLNQPALAAAMTASCRAQDEQINKSDIYHKFIKALFKTQDSWAFDQKYIDKLEAIAMLDGMSSERFRRCIEDNRLQTKFLEDRMNVAKTLQLHSTPTFYINGEVLEGYIDYRTIKKAIERNLKK